MELRGPVRVMVDDAKRVCVEKEMDLEEEERRGDSGK
jgi:hypothetical protein